MSDIMIIFLLPFLQISFGKETTYGDARLSVCKTELAEEMGLPLAYTAESICCSVRDAAQCCVCRQRSRD